MALNLTFHNGKRVESFSFTLAVPDGFDVLQNIGDPACGSGNFLTETYISLRRLENDVLIVL